MIFILIIHYLFKFIPNIMDKNLNLLHFKIKSLIYIFIKTGTYTPKIKDTGTTYIIDKFNI